MAKERSAQNATNQPGQKETPNTEEINGALSTGHTNNTNGGDQTPDSNNSIPSNGTPVAGGIAAAGGDDIQTPSIPIPSAADISVWSNQDAQSPIIVSNQGFLAAIFGELLWPGVHVTGFACRPENTGVIEWAGQYAYLADSTKVLERVDLNQYFTVSTFRPDGSGRSRRRKADFMAQFCLVIDDLGSGPGAKVPWELAAGKPGFSWILETSPDNYQAGYIFTVPVSDADLLVRLVDAMIAQGLMSDRDPGMRGVTRYVRMPLGMNNKEKYGEIPFQCRMVEWHPERKYSVEEIVGGWGLQLAAPGTGGGNAGAGAGTAGRTGGAGGTGVLNSGLEGDTYDLIEVVLDEIGLRGRAQGNGFFGCPCPNEAEHTIADGRTGYDPGQGFKCFHGSCETLNRGDLRKWLSEEHTEAYDRALEERHSDPAYAESMFGPPQPLPTQVNAETGAVEVIPARAQMNTYPWFVARAEALSSEAGDAQAIESLITDGVVYLGNIEMDRLLGVINEQTGVTKQRLRTSESRAKKSLLGRNILPGSGATTVTGQPGGSQVANGTVEPDVQGPIGVVAIQGGVPGRVPQVTVGSYDDVYGVGDGCKIVNETLVPYNTPDNLGALCTHVGVRIFFNEMTREVEIIQVRDYGFAGMDNNDTKVQMGAMMTVCGMSKADAGDFISLLANRNTYHPVAKWLENVAWDGVDRIKQVRGCVAATHPDHFEFVFDKWLMGAMACVYGYGKRPPRGVLVFTGGQSVGKTEFLKKIAPKPVGSYKVGITLRLSGNKAEDDTRKATSTLLGELSELDGIFRVSDIAHMKTFISQETDEYRLPYKPEMSKLPRRTVFFGTVNTGDFLKDETGNTRYWTVESTTVDLNTLDTIDNQQLWAQIKHRFDMGGRDPMLWQMNSGEVARVEERNAHHRAVTPEEEEVLSYFDWDDPVYCEGQPWNKGSFDEHCRLYRGASADPATGEPGGSRVIQLSTREVARKIGQEDSFGNSQSKFNKELVKALRALTKMPKGYATKINRKKTTVWYLPRVVDANGLLIMAQRFPAK